MGWQFTLLELLITIAIIAILASLLLPGLNSAREAARKSTCMNNLKMIGTAANLYRQDFDDHIMPPLIPGVGVTEPGHAYAHFYHWPFYYGSQYLKGKLVSGQCPTFSDPGKAWKTFLCPSDPKQGYSGRSYATYRFWLSSEYGNGKVSKQKQASSQYLISEFDYWNFFSNSMASSGWSAPNVNYGSSTGEVYLNDSQSMGPNHANSANILYLDSHVAARKHWDKRPVRTYWADSYSPKDG